MNATPGPAPSPQWLEEPSALAWMGPEHRPTPAQALIRIQALCQMHSDLFSAMLTVLATHQTVPREVTAAALKQFRADLEPYSREDVQGLLVAVWNGGKSGFDAVLRTRAHAPRKGGALSWVKD